MATPKSQRIGILIITIVMIVGTLGSFIVMVIANDNAQRDQAAAQKQYDEYMAKTNAQQSELNTKYYPVISQYAARVAAFDAAAVTSVTSEDLLVGEGEVIGDSTQYSAYYIGWTPDGKIFDQSIMSGQLKEPIPGSGLIPGWTEGVKGMKLGGVREISIDSDKAYGDKGQKDPTGREIIPPNTPLKFIVLAIPTPTPVPYPGLG